MEALDALQFGDLIVFATGNDLSGGVWGELSTAARAQGAVGAVDGLTRDAGKICKNKFPVVALGISSYDSHGRSEVLVFDLPIECGGVQVNRGDIEFADYDGVAIVPLSIPEPVLESAESKAFCERIVDDEF